MNILAVIRLFNDLKRRHLIRDYVIFGVIASSYYIEPISTLAIDILILTDTDQEYIQSFRVLKTYATKVQDFTFTLGDTPVQVFPTSMGPLYRDTLVTARTVRIGSLRTKIADREHLIVLLLNSFRLKDRIKLAMLLPKADRLYLNELFRRFDKDGTWTKRLRPFD